MSFSRIARRFYTFSGVRFRVRGSRDGRTLIQDCRFTGDYGIHELDSMRVFYL